jgi:hypothetical protein
VFQRSSSNVAGRNGCLSLDHCTRSGELPENPACSRQTVYEPSSLRKWTRRSTVADSRSKPTL